MNANVTVDWCVDTGFDTVYTHTHASETVSHRPFTHLSIPSRRGGVYRGLLHNPFTCLWDWSDTEHPHWSMFCYRHTKSQCVDLDHM